MYHPIKDQELHPENYVLSDISWSYLEDDCHDFLSKPRQTQSTIGMYLKKVKGSENTKKEDTVEESLSKQFRPSPNEVDRNLENLLQENKAFWVDKPTVSGPLVYKLQELYTVKLPRRDINKGQGIFLRPDYLELDYLIKLGQAGLLYPDEEITDSEDEIKPDETMCLPLRKKKYKICDPCKPKREKKTIAEETKIDKVHDLPIKKIPTGCQCNYYGEHNKEITVWDFPYRDEVDMIRNHEMDKWLKPFKSELFNNYYKKNKPVSFNPATEGSKRIFPEFMLSSI